jgi:uroporphyrin-III C-methyltransferase/precorrin-2 dehydrogenase/sirohydrochlorin ferrochelatase/uroporphyrin-III C-methyltransferase
MSDSGIVSLVGAGPGDPELLTLKALRLIRDAQVVVYDRLVSPEILNLFPPGVPRIAVGKAPGQHCVPQAQINELLLAVAKRGRRVVRLKGGDPFIFGRGGEEALFLKRHGIRFEIVPGITSASAASAYAGIPLTHRGLARTVHLVTGHLGGDEPLDLPWESLARADSTLAVYMGLANLAIIRDRLIGAGLDPATPAAAIQSGTTADQRRVLATLGTLPAAVAAAGLEAPVMLVIGRVVGLADALDWFELTEMEMPDAQIHSICG